MALSPEQHVVIMQALTAVRQRFPGAQLEPQSIAGSAPIFRCVVNGETGWIPFLPGDVQLCASLQEARRKVLVYDVQHLPALQAGLGSSPNEADLPPLDAPPACARFEAHQVVRVPVVVEARAQDFLDASNAQARIFPQALAEAFGEVAGIGRVMITYLDARRLEVPHLSVTAEAERAYQSRTWHLRTDEIRLRNVNTTPIFQARHAASELVRLYLESQKRR